MLLPWLFLTWISQHVSGGTFIEEHFERCPVECACQGPQVDCSGRELTEVPTSLPTWTEILYLRDNRISTIHSSAFQGLSRLILLDLSNNLIDSIHTDVFESIPQLHSLELRDNNLHNIPPGIESFTGLKLLNVRGNKIENISMSDIGQITRVEQVDLSDNSISNWPEFTGESESSKLIELDLSDNDLTQLHRNAFSSLKNLISIRLSGNHIERVEPDAFKGLVHLKSIDLSHNSIRAIEAISFHGLDELDRMSLAHNEMTRIYAGAFYGLTNLQTLNLASNKLNSMSDGELFGLTNLLSLDLSDNLLTHIHSSTWTYAKNLEWLSIAQNQLIELSSHAFGLSKLRHLSLADNKIENVHRSALEGLDALEILDVSMNNLAICVEDGSILQNASLPILKSLNFAANRLRVIPSNAFSKFPNLTSLNLLENPISTIHTGAFEPIRLEELAMNTSSLICDCKMQWFSDWLFRSGLDKSKIKTICSYPVTLKDIDLRYIDVTNLTCANESPQARVILQPVPSMKALLGKDAKLSCSGYGAKPLEIKWKMFEKNGRSRWLAEDSTLVFFTNHTQDGHDAYVHMEMAYSELNFLRITRQDEAEYQCIVQNSYGTAYSDRARLLVRQVPEFLDTPKDIVTVVGRNIGFPCRATGIASPIMSWEKDHSKTFPAAIERRMHIMQDDNSLFILNVTKADAGSYTCYATNDVGEVSVSAQLEVYEISFQGPLENQRVNAGDSLRFHCSVQAEPSVSIRWYHDAEMVPANETSRIYTHGDRGEHLVVEQVHPSDAGLYSCDLVVRGITLARQSAKVRVMPYLATSFEPPILDLKTSEALQLSTHPVQPHPEEGLRNFFSFNRTTMISIVIFVLVLSGIFLLFRSRRRNLLSRRDEFYESARNCSTLTTTASEKRDTLERYANKYVKEPDIALLRDP